MVRDAQKAVMRYRRMLHMAGPQPSSLAALVLRDTRQTLQRIVESGTKDFGVRLLYAEVLHDSNDNAEALKVVTQLLKDGPPAPFRSEALGELAILHAIADRREEEIKAYTDALAIEPHAYRRARLLANRAEAYMAMGDVTAAVEGYRASLARLTAIEMYFYGSTTFFGLGVALDRSGNPEAALDAVRIARTYDPKDARFNDGNWFFSPAYDAHWYYALGGWSCGRFAQSWAARAACYETAVDEWGLYVESAPESDRWLPLARVRLAQVTRERDQLKKAFEAQRKAQEADRKKPDMTGTKKRGAGVQPPWEAP